MGNIPPIVCQDNISLSNKLIKEAIMGPVLDETRTAFPNFLPFQQQI